MDLFVIGFVSGMAVLYGLVLIRFYFPRKPKEDYKPDYEEIKIPVIHEERLHSVPVTVSVDLAREELTAFSSNEYKNHVITGKLKLKLIDKLWEFVKVDMEYNPMNYTCRYYAKLMVFLPVRQALKVEVEKEKF